MVNDEEWVTLVRTTILDPLLAHHVVIVLMHFVSLLEYCMSYINALHLVINSKEVVCINNINESMMWMLNGIRNIYFKSSVDTKKYKCNIFKKISNS